MGGPNHLKLKEYQLIGLNWLWLMWRMGLGGILADEMGLGKTIQVISVLCAIKESGWKGKHLVVAPASVIDNWQREITLWAPELLVVKYHGAQKDRQRLRDDFRDVPFDVALTTYTYFEGEQAATADDRRWLNRFQWGVLVLDEGHALKKAGSSRYKRLSNLRTKQRLLLTGTPVQNNLSELLTMLSFANEDIFPPILPIAFEEVEKARGDSSRSGNRMTPEVSRARRMLASFLLRRKKADVLTQLVRKIEIERSLTMSGRQKEVYLKLMGEAEELRRQQKEKEEEEEEVKRNPNRPKRGNGSTSTSGGGNRAVEEAKKKATASLFSDLRKAANHPCLLRSFYTDKNDLEHIARQSAAARYFGPDATLPKVREEIATYSDLQLHEICSEVESLEHLMLSRRYFWIRPSLTSSRSYCRSSRRRAIASSYSRSIWPCSICCSTFWGRRAYD